MDGMMTKLVKWHINNFSSTFLSTGGMFGSSCNVWILRFFCIAGEALRPETALVAKEKGTFWIHLEYDGKWVMNQRFMNDPCSRSQIEVWQYMRYKLQLQRHELGIRVVSLMLNLRYNMMEEHSELIEDPKCNTSWKVVTFFQHLWKLQFSSICHHFSCV